MASRSKIAHVLSEADLSAFLDELRHVPALTGAKIVELAAARWELKISHNSANNFLRKEFEPYLEKISKARQLARFLGEHADPGAVGSVADAGALQLSQVLFEFMLESGADLDLADPEQLERAESISRILGRLRAGDAKRDELQIRVQKLEEEKAEKQAAIDAAKNAASRALKGPTAETIAAAEAALKLL